MKIKVKLFIILFTILSISTYATDSDLDFQSTDVKNEFSKVDKLEKYLVEHPDVTLEELKQTKPELLKGFDLIANTDTNFAPTKNMPLVGGFWWGCCLGVVGLALVYFITDHDKDQVRKAFWGCVIATVLWGVGGLWNPFSW
jgi:hypothetical protein